MHPLKEFEQGCLFQQKCLLNRLDDQLVLIFDCLLVSFEAVLQILREVLLEVVGLNSDTSYYLCAAVTVKYRCHVALHLFEFM